MSPAMHVAWLVLFCWRFKKDGSAGAQRNK